MIVIDSSGWLEYLISGKRADAYADYFDDPYEILTPTVVIYEVCKKIQRDRSAEEIDIALGYMSITEVIDLDERIATDAVSFSLEAGLPMADAIIYATAQHHNVKVVTSDKHFEGLDGVVYIA